MNDEDELHYEELKRRVDYQIEENRHIEKQAERTLRLVLTTFSIVFAGTTVLYSTGALDFLAVDIQIRDLNQLQATISNSLPLTADLSALVTFLLRSGFTGMLGASLWALLIQVPVNAYRVLKVTILEPGTQPFGDTNSEAVFQRYEEVISQNEEALEETRENWKLCYKALRYSAGTGVFAIGFGLILFIYQNALLATFVAGILLLVMIVALISLIVKKVPEKTKESIQFYGFTLETGHGIAIIGAYFLGLTQVNVIEDITFWMSVVSLIGWFVCLIGFSRKNSEKLKLVLHRDTALFLVCFFLFIILQPATLPDLPTSVDLIYAVLPGTLFGSFYVTLIGMGVLTKRTLQSKLREIAPLGVLGSDLLN